MDEATLKAIIASEVTGSVGERGSIIVRGRLRATQYYRGEPFGNEEDGRSQVVSRDVAEVIDQAMPSLVKIFTAGDEIVRFGPRLTPGMDAQAVALREAQAEQATDYVNWVWRALNDGYRTTYEWFHDALLLKTGIVKIWWDDTPRVTRERYVGLTDQEADILIGDDDVEIVEMTSRPAPEAAAAQAMAEMSGVDEAQMPPLPQLHDIVIRRKNMEGQIRIAAVPLDEFLIQHRTVRLQRAPFTCHRYITPVSDLIERFPDEADAIRRLPTQNGDWSQERIERFRDEDAVPWRDSSARDESRRLVWVCESFILVDYDGDGISEMRAVVSAGFGNGAELILSNEEVDDNPFVAISPYFTPHAFWGRSLADQTEDIQLIKSALLRGALDTVYNANAPQLAVNPDQVNLDDLLTRRSGGIVRTRGAPEAAIMPIPTLNVAADAYQMLALMDNVRETRTGIRRFSQGPGADVLNNAYTDTATGANLVENSSQERIDLIARNFAETGFLRAMRLILKLEAQHRQEPRIVRLRDRWVTVDPREWDTEMDMTITVGLGTGSRQQQMQGIGFLLNIDREIIQAQGGMNGPLVTWEQLYNKLAKAVEFLGLRSPAPYYADPSNMPQQQPQQPPPDPEMVKMQQRMQLEQQHAQAQIQIAHDKAQAEMAQRQQQAQTELEIARQRAQLDMELDRQRAAQDAQLQMLKAQNEAQNDVRDAILRHQNTAAPMAALVPRGGGGT